MNVEILFFANYKCPFHCLLLIPWWLAEYSLTDKTGVTTPEFRRYIQMDFSKGR